MAARVSVNDLADRPPRTLADGETLALCEHVLRWLDTPHLPHGWDCGHLMEEQTRTLLYGELFTQGGAEHPPITDGDTLGASEAFRRDMDYFANTVNARGLLERLASTYPQTLACMHGSAWYGDGARVLRELAAAFTA